MSLRKIRALLFRQGVIREAIESEQRRPMPDSIRLLRLKRLNLALKDQLSRLAAALEPVMKPVMEPARAPARKQARQRVLAQAPVSNLPHRRGTTSYRS